MARKIDTTVTVKDKGSAEIKKFSRTSSRAMKKLRKDFDETNRRALNFGKSIFSLRTAVVGLAGAGAMGYLIKRTVALADSTVKTADKLGLSTGYSWTEVLINGRFFCFTFSGKAKLLVKRGDAKWINDNTIEYWGEVNKDVEKYRFEL